MIGVTAKRLQQPWLNELAKRCLTATQGGAHAPSISQKQGRNHLRATVFGTMKTNAVGLWTKGTRLTIRMNEAVRAAVGLLRDLAEPMPGTPMKGPQ